MRNLRGGIGCVCLVALWLWTGLVSAHSQTGKACTENAAFYEHEYTVNDVRIDLPLGWLLSAILSGVSTWLLGHALYHYYEQDQAWILPSQLTDHWQRTIERAQAAQRRWDPAAQKNRLFRP